MKTYLTNLSTQHQGLWHLPCRLAANVRSERADAFGISKGLPSLSSGYDRKNHHMQSGGVTM